MSNVSSGSNCTEAKEIAESLFITTYYVITPFYFLFGLVGHSISFTVFYREIQKKRVAYCYQLFVSISSIFELFTQTALYASIATYGLIGAEHDNWAARVFASNYAVMWYYAHLASPLENAFMTSTLLLTVGTAFDRTLAIGTPMAYKNFAHKRRQWLTFTVCMGLGLGTSAFDVLRKVVTRKDDETYFLVYDQVYTNQVFVQVLSQLRNVVRIAGLIALICCNVALMHLYRVKLSKVAPGISDEKASQRKDNEKMLAFLAIYESVSHTVSMSTSVLYYILFYSMPGFSQCGIHIMAPIVDMSFALTNGFSFYGIVLISKKYRNLVRENFAKGFICT